MCSMTPILLCSDYYRVLSLHTTKGSSSCIIRHYITGWCTVMKRLITEAIHTTHNKISGQNIIPYTFASKRTIHTAMHYNTTLFSWPTRNRVFNIMSNPASSIFLQKATSSLHISTNSKPSFPRILWSSRLKNG